MVHTVHSNKWIVSSGSTEKNDHDLLLSRFLWKKADGCLFAFDNRIEQRQGGCIKESPASLIIDEAKPSTC
jgi:hypothetical protein